MFARLKFEISPRLLLGSMGSGLLLALCFPPFNQPWAVWGALIPVLFGLHLSSPALPVKRVWWMGYLMGVLYFGLCFWWIGLVTVGGAMALILYLSVYPAVWLCWAAGIWKRRVPYTSGQTLLTAIELANAWVILEWIRGWMFSGFGWDGLGVALGTDEIIRHWHGYLPLLQGARLGGVFLLSWIIVLMNVIGVLTFIRFWHEIRREQPMLAHLDFNAAMLLIALLFAYGLQGLLLTSRAPKLELSYAMLQANIPQTLDRPMEPSEVFHREQELSKVAAAAKPQLLVWSESPTGGGVLTDPNFYHTVREVQMMGDFSFLFGSENKKEGKYYNSAFFLSGPDDPPQIYDKNRLVPFGEFTPLAEQIPWLHHLMPFETDFTPGTSSQIFVLPKGGLRIAPLICFEDTLPDQVRRAAAAQPDLLVNLTNDGWFQNSPGAQHHLLNAIFRAVETDLPLLRCANTGITAVISPEGKVDNLFQVGGQSIGVSGVLSGTLRWSAHRDTLYQKLGNWVVWLALIINLRIRVQEIYRWIRGVALNQLWKNYRRSREKKNRVESET